MARTIKEGEKQIIAARVVRERGSGAFTLTVPERRILDGNRALVAGFDWGAATWDAVSQDLSAPFDSTLSGLIVPGTYYMQLRGTIATERYVTEVKVILEDIGP